MQNIIKEIKSRLDVIEEKISELEDRIMKSLMLNRKKDKIIKEMRTI